MKMEKLKTLELELEQKKEGINHLKLKHSSIEDMLLKKIARLEKKIRKLEIKMPGKPKSSISRNSTEEFDALKSKIAEKRFQRENFGKKVQELHTQSIAKSLELENYIEKLSQLEEELKQLNRAEEEIKLSIQKQKDLKGQLRQLNIEIANYRSNQEELQDKKLRLEEQISEKMQFLVNSSSEIPN
ncbi:MAG: hypothetical protein ACXAEU_01065 [Candidatus Hodarchaeales archaeon]